MKKLKKTPIINIESCRHKAHDKRKVSINKKISPALHGKNNNQKAKMMRSVPGRTHGIEEDKIAALKDAIEKGNYVINSKEIADRLIRESLILLYLQAKLKTFH